MTKIAIFEKPIDTKTLASYSLIMRSLHNMYSKNPSRNVKSSSDFLSNTIYPLRRDVVGFLLCMN